MAYHVNHRLAVYSIQTSSGVLTRLRTTVPFQCPGIRRYMIKPHHRYAQQTLPIATVVAWSVCQFCLPVCWSRPSALQKRKNQSKYRFGCGLKGPTPILGVNPNPVQRKGHFWGSHVLWHVHNCPRLIFSTFFARGSNDAASVYYS